jgi:hypothetical protein
MALLRLPSISVSNLQLFGTIAVGKPTMWKMVIAEAGPSKGIFAMAFLGLPSVSLGD